ncbi:serine/arginine repetitive matrix protein 1-like isoform X2 [Cavia porcellus]|uniref:serine/arginine repetitive matrix protein 1-like isoform X2 n=1 Tax=Cavia porcellus TaxID=10141 RepID=UPI002FE0B0BD
MCPRRRQAPFALQSRPAGQRARSAAPRALTCVADDNILKKIGVRHGHGRPVPGTRLLLLLLLLLRAPRPAPQHRSGSKRRLRPPPPPPPWPSPPGRRAEEKPDKLTPPRSRRRQRPTESSRTITAAAAPPPRLRADPEVLQERPAPPEGRGGDPHSAPPLRSEVGLCPRLSLPHRVRRESRRPKRRLQVLTEILAGSPESTSLLFLTLLYSSVWMPHFKEAVSLLFTTLPSSRKSFNGFSEVPLGFPFT